MTPGQMQAELQYMCDCMETAKRFIAKIPVGYLEAKLEIEHMQVSCQWWGRFDPDALMHDRLTVYMEPSGVFAIYTHNLIYRGRFNLSNIDESWYHEHLKLFREECT